MKSKMSLKVKLTLSIGIMFLCMVFILTFASLEALNRLLIMPVQEVIPAIPLEPSKEIEKAQLTVPSQTVMDALPIIVATGQIKYNTLAFVAMGLVGIVGTISTYFIVSKTLSPLNKLTNKIEKIDENVINESLAITTSSKEVEQLTESFNKMLKRLELSFSSQKRFSTAAAHELKTPLAVIKTNLEVLDDSPTVEEYKHLFEVTKRQINRMNDLVNTLMLVASSSSYECNQEISLNKIIRDTLDELSQRIDDKGISIQIKGNDERIQGNELMLHRAFSNIIENAIKYSQEGSPLIEIEITSTEYNIEVTIKDNGIGIEKDQLNLIFEPFYRVEKSRSRDIGGSGLGLTLVKEIIEQHQGKIEIASQINEGTTIKMIFKRRLI